MSQGKYFWIKTLSMNTLSKKGGNYKSDQKDLEKNESILNEDDGYDSFKSVQLSAVLY